jgi:hypothetical protein
MVAHKIMLSGQIVYRQPLICIGYGPQQEINNSSMLKLSRAWREAVGK